MREPIPNSDRRPVELRAFPDANDHRVTYCASIANSMTMATRFEEAILEGIFKEFIRRYVDENYQALVDSIDKSRIAAEVTRQVIDKIVLDAVARMGAK